MERQDRGKELVGCLLYLSRGIAILAAVGGGVKGLVSGDMRMALYAIVLAILCYIFMWVGAKLILRCVKKDQ